MNKNLVINKLHKLQSELETRIDKITNDMEKGHSHDWSEQAQERENDDVLDELSREAKEQLVAIHKAISKIENNQYGICEKCGNTISEERLTAMPAAELCINCAE